MGVSLRVVRTEAKHNSKTLTILESWCMAFVRFLCQSLSQTEARHSLSKVGVFRWAICLLELFPICGTGKATLVTQRKIITNYTFMLKTMMPERIEKVASIPFPPELMALVADSASNGNPFNLSQEFIESVASGSLEINISE